MGTPWATGKDFIMMPASSRRSHNIETNIGLKDSPPHIIAWNSSNENMPRLLVSAILLSSYWSLPLKRMPARSRVSNALASVKRTLNHRSARCAYSATLVSIDLSYVIATGAAYAFMSGRVHDDCADS